MIGTNRVGGAEEKKSAEVGELEKKLEEAVKFNEELQNENVDLKKEYGC